MAEYDFGISLENFNEGLAPLAHIDSQTFIGSKGQASEMKADIITLPGYLQQPPQVTNLTNGSEAGVVDQLIRFILDKPTASDTTYAVGTTKLFKLSSTTVVSGGSPSWPQTITSMTSGESIVRCGANLFTFYNTSSAGDIAAMPLSTEVIDPDWGSSTDQALEKAPHPAATKEDIIVFGNGRYAGVYVEGSASLDVRKLDFGAGAEVADVVFSANVWWISVNYGEGRRSQIYLYDGSAISNQLSDEAGIGSQKIGFLFVQNGNIFIAYQDLSSGGYTIGWLSGRQLKPLRYFSGTLPDHRQKTLYKNTILFASGEDIWSVGAPVDQLAIQVSKLTDGGHTTLGGIAAPFGTPMVASTQSTSYRIGKFATYSSDSSWKSINLDITDHDKIGKITAMIVITKPLAATAKAEISLLGNQGQTSSSAFEITGENKTRHVFKSINLVAAEDVRVFIDFSEGGTTYPCPIRKIILLGMFVER